MHDVGQVTPPQNAPQYTPSALQNPGASRDPSQGYQPYPSSAVAGAPYYAPPSGQQQQQQVTVTTGQAQVFDVQAVQSFLGAIIYSCFVLCFNPLFGLIGFYLACEYCVWQWRVTSRRFVHRVGSAVVWSDKNNLTLCNENCVHEVTAANRLGQAFDWKLNFLSKINFNFESRRIHTGYSCADVYRVAQ